MKIKILGFILVTAVLSSCAEVQTCDADGNLVGQCRAEWIFWLAARCVGSANPVDQVGKNYIQRISDTQALYTALYALFQFRPDDAEAYLKNDVSINMMRGLDLYIAEYKMSQGMNGREYPSSDLNDSERAFLDWLVKHPAFSDISGAFKK